MVYVQIIDGYITDCIRYEYDDYVPVDAKNPPDVLNGCYQLTSGAFVRDEVKYQEWLDAQPPPEPPEPPAAGQLTQEQLDFLRGMMTGAGL